MSRASRLSTRMEQSRVMTQREVRLVKNRHAIAAPAAPNQSEMAWHTARINESGDGPEEGEGVHTLFAVLIVALTHEECWVALAKSCGWFWRYASLPNVRWHVWNYFCELKPVITTGYFRFWQSVRQRKHGIEICLRKNQPQIQEQAVTQRQQSREFRYCSPLLWEFGELRARLTGVRQRAWISTRRRRRHNRHDAME